MPLGLGKAADRHEPAQGLGQNVTAALEPGVELEGKMQVASGAVRINTTFKGEILGQGTVLVGEQGEVDANIEANGVIIRGKVKGAVHTKERLEIQEHGVLLGDIYTPVLIVEPGGYFDGHCHMPAPGVDKSAATQLQPGDKSI